MSSEKQNRILFLEVKIIRKDKTFTTSVYRKPTPTGFYTHFKSFLSSTYKFGTVYTLAYRSCKFAQVGVNYTMD